MTVNSFPLAAAYACTSAAFESLAVNENLTLRTRSASLYRMKLVRLLILVFALGVLLINTGDCVNFFFAEAKASECCLKEDCPMAAAGQMDTCCKTPVSQSAKYVQGPSHASVAQPSTAIVDFPTQNVLAGGPQQVANLSGNRQDHAPPGGNFSLSLPLLI